MKVQLAGRGKNILKTVESICTNYAKHQEGAVEINKCELEMYKAVCVLAL